jgi:regulator of protease activity HflC (stomatin/prohibitin superfamily)
VLLIPWVDTLAKHHVRQQTIRFDRQEIMIRDGLIFSINAAVIFRVTDIYRALFEIEDLHNSLADISMGILRDVFTGRDHTNLSKTKEISALLLEELKEKAQQWGVDFLQFNIIDCAPTSETAQIIIAKAGVMMKAEALQEMAKKLRLPLDQLNPTLAAVLVGVPLVASTSGTPHRDPTDHTPQAEPEPSLISRMSAG